MKSEKTDKMQAPGAGKDAKAAAGIEAAAGKKRTTAEQPESEGKYTPVMLVAHDASCLDHAPLGGKGGKSPFGTTIGVIVCSGF